MEKTVKFILDGETDNTRKFKEVQAPGEPKIIGRLYLQKFILEQAGNPETVTVTVSM